MSGLDAIGGTAVVRVDGLHDRADAAAAAEIWVKCEAANPTGSYKDRMALAMIEGAERDGRLKPGQLVVEYTGGSTCSSLAFVCAQKGYPLRIVASDAFALEKIRTMEAFGGAAADRRLLWLGPRPVTLAMFRPSQGRCSQGRTTKEVPQHFLGGGRRERRHWPA